MEDLTARVVEVAKPIQMDKLGAILLMAMGA